ncbi:MAG: FAD-dependent oxidoreductase [Desulfurococcaceae archaeon]|nr:FAD-dependent oxidoreductase [Desulfurococcaceae archaeon]
MSFKLRTSMIPSTSEITRDKYDVIVVGGGPAGLTATLYCARLGLDTVVITKTIGGLVAEAPVVDDYLGLPDVKGADLADRFFKHVKKYGVPVILDEVVDVFKRSPEDYYWCVKLKNTNRVLCAYAVVLAMGSEKRKLGVPGEDRLLGKGVSYCAICDGPLYRGKDVAVIGGGNSAFTAALFLANIANKVYLIHRRSTFRAFKVYVDAALTNRRIEIIVDSTVKEIVGENAVEGIRVVNLKTGEERYIKVDGVFVEIGLKPPTEFFKKLNLEVDEEGRAVVNIDRSTSLKGIYVVGDAAGGPYKYKLEQIITAAADGAIAADAISKYIALIKSGVK